MKSESQIDQVLCAVTSHMDVVILNRNYEYRSIPSLTLRYQQDWTRALHCLCGSVVWLLLLYLLLLYLPTGGDTNTIIKHRNAKFRPSPVADDRNDLAVFRPSVLTTSAVNGTNPIEPTNERTTEGRRSIQYATVTVKLLSCYLFCAALFWLPCHHTATCYCCWQSDRSDKGRSTFTVSTVTVAARWYQVNNRKAWRQSEQELQQ